MNIHLDIIDLHNISLQLRYLKIIVFLSSPAWGQAIADLKTGVCSPMTPGLEESCDLLSSAPNLLTGAARAQSDLWHCARGSGVGVHSF